MAKIELQGLAHAYRPAPSQPQDFALQSMTMTWQDGGAYALLGPSGCGKTTLLNIISGLVRPSHGRVLFDGRDVTDLPPEKRNIAQVFQFPVIYDTMSVFDNLAFPLRNRRVEESEVRRRVSQVAELLELSSDLKKRARGLTADMLQKISLGRGLVRQDVAAILFDEPLTVIDPHLKWQLRSKLKEIHQQLKLSFIYVTHDQVEALTFASQVVVMLDGAVVQTGTPEALFLRPEHTFVGYFIGSPGMNLLPCRLESGAVVVGTSRILMPNLPATNQTGEFVLGIRPEYLQLKVESSPNAVATRIVAIDDLGDFKIVSAELGGQRLKLKIAQETPVSLGTAYLFFPPEHSKLYCNSRLV